jgi:hypothetical protein
VHCRLGPVPVRGACFPFHLASLSGRRSAPPPVDPAACARALHGRGYRRSRYRSPMILASMRIIGCVPWRGARFGRSSRALSISLICPRMSCSLAKSRRNSAMVFAGSGSPSGPRNASRCFLAWRSLTLKVRIPNRINVDLIRFTARVCSRISASRSRVGRRASLGGVRDGAQYRGVADRPHSAGVAWQRYGAPARVIISLRVVVGGALSERRPRARMRSMSSLPECAPSAGFADGR